MIKHILVLVLVDYHHRLVHHDAPVPVIPEVSLDFAMDYRDTVFRYPPHGLGTVQFKTASYAAQWRHVVIGTDYTPGKPLHLAERLDEHRGDLAIGFNPLPEILHAAEPYITVQVLFQFLWIVIIAVDIHAELFQGGECDLQTTGNKITKLQFDAPLQDFLRMEGDIVTLAEILGQGSLLRDEFRVVFQLQIVHGSNTGV